MAAHLSGRSFAGVVRTLRAAGCVFAEDEARVLVASTGDDTELAALVRRRAGGEPLEQLLGWAAFFGRRVTVRPGVFVPRRRTEFLAARAIAAARPGAVVVDLCCGSGPVAVALATAGRGADVYAVDLDPVAVRCARQNLEPVGGRVYLGDLYAPLPAALRGRVDVLVANVPYVPTSSIGMMPPEARLHEPTLALDGGADGLAVLRRVAAGAGPWLAPGGVLLVETSQRQAPSAIDVFAQYGLLPRAAHCAELDATVVVGEAPPAPALRRR